MRRLPLNLRRAFLALALLQSGSGAALAVADGFTSGRDVALPAHVEDQGATHNARAHSHDCLACRELRAGQALPSAPRFAAVEEDPSSIPSDAALSIVGRTAHATCARGPPAGIG